MPTSSIQFVYPDSYGYLWMATFDGLVRWDGYTFKKYRHEENNANSLNNNIVYSLYEDSHHRLWVATIDGLSLYDRSRDAFQRCQITHDSSKVPVNTILEDKLHRLWLGTSDGLCTYDYDSGKAQWFGSENEEDIIFCMAVDANNDLWLGTFNKGLKKFTTSNQKFQSFRYNPSQPGSIKSDKIRSILVDSDNNIWLGSENKGISILNTSGQLIKKIENFPGLQYNAQSTINCIYEDKSHTIWIGLRRELVYYIKKGFSTPQALESSSVNNNHEKLASITCIREDQFGNTWFASANNGLFNTNTHKNVFRNYLYDPNQIENLSTRVVSAFFEDRNGLAWIGTNGGGILQFDPAKNTVIRPAKPALPSGIIYDIKGDKEGNLWIANWGGGIIRYNPVTGKTEQFVHNPNDLNSIIFNDVKSILPDDTLIWIGTHGEGLAAFDIKRNRFIHYKNNHTFPFSMHEPSWINHLYKDSRKRLWISTYNGLYVFNGEKLIHFEHSADTTSISSNSVNMVVEDKAGRIWLVGESGLDAYNEQSGNFTR